MIQLSPSSVTLLSNYTRTLHPHSFSGTLSLWQHGEGTQRADVSEVLNVRPRSTEQTRQQRAVARADLPSPATCIWLPSLSMNR